MSRPNRNLQAKYMKACAQKREASHMEYSKAGYRNGNTIASCDGAKHQTLRQSKPAPYLRHAEKVMSPLRAAWVDGGTMLIRNGVVISVAM